MTNPNKRRGDTYERAVLQHVQHAGHPDAERTRAGYARDWGDIHLDPTRAVVVQCKNHARWALPEWLTQLAEQVRDAGARHGVLVIKRRGTGQVGRHYAVLEFGDYLDLLADAGYGTDATRPRSVNTDPANSAPREPATPQQRAEAG